MQKQRLTSTRRADWRSLITIALALPILLVLSLFFYFRPIEKTASLQSAVLASGEYAPFSSEQLEGYGIASAIVVQAMKEIGYESEIRFLPWPLVSESTKESATNQGIRGAFPFAKTADREKDFYFSDPVVEVETAIFYNAQKTPAIADMAEIGELGQDYSLLPIKGYQYLTAVENLPQLTAAAEDNVDAFTQLLENPQAHLVAEAQAVGEQVLAESFPRQRQYIKSISAYTSPLYLIASKRNPYNRELILKFNQALAAIDAEERAAIAEAIVAQLDEQNQVLLNAFAASGYLYGYVAPGEERLLLPKGTRAVVEQWPEAYLMASQQNQTVDSDTVAWVKVKILNGPLRQESLYVDSRTVSLPQ